MRARLVALVAALAVLLAIPTTGTGSTLADPYCPFGTNWDNSIQACK